MANQISMRTGEIVDNKMDAETENILAAEAAKDKGRMDWLLANSCIIVNGIYHTTRESLDEAITSSGKCIACGKPTEGNYCDSCAQKSWKDQTGHSLPKSDYRYECLCRKCGKQFVLPSQNAEHVCPSCK